MSTISTYAEVAYLKPDHSKAINGETKGVQVYVDDFEGTSNGYTLTTPPGKLEVGFYSAQFALTQADRLYS